MFSAYLGITDNNWFDYLQQNQITDEVNFWIPSAPVHKNVEPGTIWLFKLHSPFDFIVGAGVFMHYFVLPLQMAWDVFKDHNGMATFEEFQKSIMKHKQSTMSSWNIDVGCAVLGQIVYLPRRLWIPYRTNSLVSGKHMGDTSEQAIVKQVLNKIQLTPLMALVNNLPLYNSNYTPQYALAKVRRGQGIFRVEVTDAYCWQCAVSREHSLPVLEAAHIVAWANTHENDINNGILLRADIHKLFDAGYVTIDADNYKFVVSKRLKDDFDNGKEYYQLHGTQILLPNDVAKRPDKNSLIAHNTNVFR
jgi:putative restriction endonuclease